MSCFATVQTVAELYVPKITFPYKLNTVTLNMSKISHMLDPHLNLQEIRLGCRLGGIMKHPKHLELSVKLCWDKNLTTLRKYKVCDACVLSILLYGSETWTRLKKYVQN